MISVILPTYNESMNIREMIARIKKSVPDAEIIVSDDNSPDKTWKVRGENVHVIRRMFNKGVGPAIWDGIKKAKGNILVWMDADLTMPPELIPRMVKSLQENDIVVGSRYVQGGKDKRSFIRVLTSRMINLFANLVLNFKVRDYDSGFIAAKREVLNTVGFQPKGHGEYCIEFLYKAGCKGYKIKEIGFVFTERKKGESKSAQYLSSILKYGVVYIKKILSLR
ncbi:MAG TPA: polyprenol monophosphomannose synthase [Candidatus Nanoarchaeia archaeon]|nr:polyprenol monophosphomannose synthase [Candidatus Nanoarchaeia archaeon]